MEINLIYTTLNSKQIEIYQYVLIGNNCGWSRVLLFCTRILTTVYRNVLYGCSKFFITLYTMYIRILSKCDFPIVYIAHICIQIKSCKITSSNLLCVYVQSKLLLQDNTIERRKYKMHPRIIFILSKCTYIQVLVTVEYTQIKIIEHLEYYLQYT